MSKPIVVLKFGSSVLKDKSALPAAVLEIYREVQRDHRVVAVVSAFGETTDSLLLEAGELSDRPDPYAIARLLETGEARSAAILGLALAQVGLATEILDAGRIGLVTSGAVLDSEPCGLDTARLRQVLDEVAVAIVPGFCGVDGQGRTTLLGRGGSDLTALYLAHHLEAAECRLLKDVDGLLRVNPDGTLDYGTRYAVAHYDDCLRVGGPLIQPKAVEFAARNEQRFTVARCGSQGGTQAGPLPSQFETVPTQPRRLRVALAGLGSVGLGVFRWLQHLSEDFEVTHVLVKDASAERSLDVPRSLLTTEWSDLLTPLPDLVIEVIGGTDVAAELMAATRRHGIAVVTANKQLLALDPSLLRALATDGSHLVKASASVGGGLPALEHTALISDNEPITVLRGVLNGTCNFVLDRMLAGITREDAIAEAQELGLAEADPHLDISGLDSVYKLSLLATTAFADPLAPDEILCEGLDRVTADHLAHARQQGKVLKLVAEVRRHGGRIVGRVGVRALAPDHPLAQCRREANCLLVETASGQTHRLDGLGAGRWPTTCSVLADALEVRRRLTAPGTILLQAARCRTGISS